MGRLFQYFNILQLNLIYKYKLLPIELDDFRSVPRELPHFYTEIQTIKSKEWYSHSID